LAPYAARDGLQANAVLVRGEDLDLFAGVLCRLLGEGIRELYGPPLFPAM
jgi:hypothetical protein